MVINLNNKKIYDIFIHFSFFPFKVIKCKPEADFIFENICYYIYGRTNQSFYEIKNTCQSTNSTLTNFPVLHKFFLIDYLQFFNKTKGFRHFKVFFIFTFLMIFLNIPDLYNGDLIYLMNGIK